MKLRLKILPAFMACAPSAVASERIDKVNPIYDRLPGNLPRAKGERLRCRVSLPINKRKRGSMLGLHTLRPVSAAIEDQTSLICLRKYA
jgi:hypothetical protein